MSPCNRKPCVHLQFTLRPGMSRFIISIRQLPKCDTLLTSSFIALFPEDTCAVSNTVEGGNEGLAISTSLGPVSYRQGHPNDHGVIASSFRVIALV
jgi:hypothetical protein